MQKYIATIIFIWVNLCFASDDACLGKSVFAIETATTTESTKLLEMIAPYQKIQRNGIKYYCGVFNNQPILLMNTGMGTAYSAATTASLINTYHPEFILFAGIAGALTNKLKYGDIVIGSEIYLWDHCNVNKDRVNYINPNTNLPNLPLLRPKQEIIKFTQTLASFKNFHVVYGKIIISSVFPETKVRLKKILAAHASAVASEDYAVLATCQLLNTKCLTIRSISDYPIRILKLSNKDEYHVTEKERLLTAKNLAEYARVFLNKWQKNPL